MTISTSQIESLFNKYNNSIFVKQFGVKLPKPKFRISTAKSYLGQFRYNCCDRDGKTYEIAISKFFKFDKAQLINTIVHEMIHEYIQYNNILDINAHGPKFHCIMNTINENNNLNISVKARNTKVASTKMNRLIAYTVNGNRHITKFVPKNEKDIVNYMKRWAKRQPIENVVIMDSSHALTQRMTLSVRRFRSYNWYGTDNVAKIERASKNKKRITL